MRADKAARHGAFVRLIDSTIKCGSPQEVKMFEGRLWVAMPQLWWCKRLSLSDRTLRDLAKEPPIVSTTTANASGKPIVYYGLSTKPHASNRHLANKMAKLYRTKYSLRRISSRHWGCLYHLAELLPKDAEVGVFKATLDNFAAFRTLVKLADPDSKFIERYYEWPVIPLLRKFPKLVLEVYVHQLQELGEVPPPSVVALFPKLWPKHMGAKSAAL